MVAEARFNSDPNRIAAAVARDWIDERSEKYGERRHKAGRATMLDAAADYAVKLLIARSPGSEHKLDIKKVVALLRAGRATWPPDGGLP
jgi:hypothetical protein